MKKTVSVSINGIQFQLTEDAYKCLISYLEGIKSVLEPENAEETMQDIEARIVELLQYELNGRQVADVKDIEKLKSVLGNPSDFDSEASSQAPDSENGSVVKKLYRDKEGGIVAGVAAGLAHYFSVDVLIVRILFIILTIFTATGILIYLILWISIPKATSSLDILKMKGEKITVKKIEEHIRKEIKENNLTFHRISQSKIGKKLNNILVLFAQIAKGILRGCLKLLTILMLFFIGIFLVIVTFVLFLGLSANDGHIVINNVEYASKNLSEIISFYVGSTKVFYWFFASLFLFLISISVLLYFLLRSISGISFGKYKNYFLVLFVTIFISASVIFGMIVSRVNDCSERASVVISNTPLKILDQDTLCILPIQDDSSLINKFPYSDDKIIISNVKVHLSTGTNFSNVYIRSEARGASKNSAFLRAKVIEYPYQIHENVLKLSRYLTIPSISSFGFQKVNIHLVVPENSVVFLSDVFDYTIYNSFGESVKNIETGFYRITNNGIERLYSIM